MGRRKSLDVKSPKKKKDSAQRTIGAAFAKAKAAPRRESLQLEVLQSAARTVDSYNAQNIRNTLEHHRHEVTTKRKHVPDATPDELVQLSKAYFGWMHCYQMLKCSFTRVEGCLFVQSSEATFNDIFQKHGRVQRRRTRYDENEDDDEEDKNDLLATDILETAERDMHNGDEDGARFLDQLQQLTSPNIAPTLEQVYCVISMVRTHGLHGRRDLSLRAFSLLQHLASLHPSVRLYQEESEGKVYGLPIVRVNPDAWSLTGCASCFNLDPFDPEAPPSRVTPFNILAHLVTAAHIAATPAGRPQEGRRTLAQTSGDLLLFKWVLSELQRDLRCRLAVFAAAGNASSQDSRKQALLQNSQTWRVFSDGALKTSVTERKALVRQLIEIIAAPAEMAALPPAASLEELALNPAELAELAACLLSLLLELYGTAEEEGMFLRHSVNRTTTTGAVEHVRMAIEAAMVEALVGSTQVLPLETLAQKRAFLTALPPKDRLRLLAILVAKGHAKRKTDGEKYPGLEQLNHLFNNHGEVGKYIQADPAEALRYIRDDLGGQSLALNLMDRTANGLSLLVSQLAQAAMSTLPGEGLGDLQTELSSVVDLLIKGAQKGPAKAALSPTSLVALRAAQHALTSAAA